MGDAELMTWAICGVFLCPSVAIVLTWLVLGIAHIVDRVRRNLDECRRSRRTLEEHRFRIEARFARRRRYPAAGGCGGWWR